MDNKDNEEEVVVKKNNLTNNAGDNAVNNKEDNVNNDVNTETTNNAEKDTNDASNDNANKNADKGQKLNDDEIKRREEELKRKYDELRKSGKIVELKVKRPSPIGTLILYFAIILLTVSLVSMLSEASQRKMTYAELIDNIKKENVSSIQMLNDRTEVYVTLKDEPNIEKRVTIPTATSFMEEISEEIATGNFDFTVSDATFWEVLEPMLPNLILIIGTFFIFMYMMKRTSQGNDKAISFGKSRARLVNLNGKNKVTFDNVAGLKEEKEELQEVVDFLKNPVKYKAMGARIPKGMLMVGGPGTGKTLLAKAVAGEAGVPFYSISGSDFVEMFVGVGASRVRDLFAEAKANSPCLIFIDEIDAVGRQRGAGLGGGHDEREQTLNQLLVEMDGFATHENVIVIAATNRPDILDKALLRPGRFDRQIVVHAPDVRAREEIIELHAKEKPFVKDIDFKTIAKNTAGFSGADLENMVNEAALLAARKDQKNITMANLEEAMVKVVMGPEKKSKVITEKERRLTAYHEAGHAVVAKFLPNHDEVHQISIIPRGMAGGYTMYKPTDDKSYSSKSEMQEDIISLLGGRVAEALVLDDISTGASNDIERATKVARSMVTKYGMSEKLGPVAYGEEQEEVFLGRDLNNRKNYSEQTAKEIDEEIRRIVDTAYKSAETILKNNIEKLHRVAKVLIEKEKIDSKEFDDIFSAS